MVLLRRPINGIFYCCGVTTGGNSNAQMKSAVFTRVKLEALVSQTTAYYRNQRLVTNVTHALTKTTVTP